MQIVTSHDTPQGSLMPVASGKVCIPTPVSHPQEVRSFHGLALEAAKEFRSFYKDASGREPRAELLLTADQERLVSEWLEGPEGRQRVQRVSDRVISFLCSLAWCQALCALCLVPGS